MACILALFCYFRLKPIYFQTVPYTYDQGRDFLKAEEVVRYKNPTFIGPTTGIMGVFHGAWWYYLLSVPYMLTGGSPVAFYYYMFLFALISFFLLEFVFLKEFGALTTIFSALFIAISPYFIRLAFFASNDTLAPFFITTLLLSLFAYFKTQKPVWSFLTFLSLGFVFEFEVAFGIFLIPLFLLALLLNAQFKLIFRNWKFNLVGFLIPTLPRLLFELKHGFQQSKAVHQYIALPQTLQNQPLRFRFTDRLSLFIDYFKQMFLENSEKLAFLFFIFIFISILLNYKKLNGHNRKIFNFIFTLVILLFIFSLFYKGFFWANYYQGIQIFFLFIISLLFFANNKSFFGKLFNFIALVAIFISTFSTLKYSSQTPTQNIGLKKHLQIVNFIYSQVKDQNFCVQVYTPPVVPYTYNYLFSYYSQRYRVKYPQSQFVNKSCWYIIEFDDYKERVDKWRASNIPPKAKRISSQKIADVKIELWRK